MNLLQYKDRFYAILEEPIIQQILHMEGFYFQKAVDKYNEYIDLQVDQSILQELIDKTKEKPFSYKKLLNQYEAVSIEGKILLLIGELVSYIDKNAAMKNELNQYEDKRTMALAFVRQNLWVQYLLSLKVYYSLGKLPEIIKNAFKYLQNPSKELTVLKENHRQAIAELFFDGNYESIIESIREIGIKSKNSMNDGCLYSIIFYQEDIRQLWDVSMNNNESNEKRIWSYAPGENGYKWDEFRQQGIMAIGWDEIGDLREYTSKKEVTTQLNEVYESEGKRTNDTLALWQFCNDIQIGDKIFAKEGSRTLLGVGEVISDYQYDENREEYKHVRKVQWTKVGRWVLDEKFAIKTLTDITDFEEFCNRINQLLNEEEVIEGQESYETYSKEQELGATGVRCQALQLCSYWYRVEHFLLIILTGGAFLWEEEGVLNKKGCFFMSFREGIIGSMFLKKRLIKDI